MTAYSFKSVGKTRVQKSAEQAAIESDPPKIGFLTPLRLGDGNDGLFAMSHDLVTQLSDNLRNLILTNHGERLVFHNLGANLRPLTLDYTGIEAFDQAAIERIKDAVSKWMPFIDLVSYTSVTRRDRGSSKLDAIDITITYGIPSLSVKDLSLTVTLYVS